MVSKRWLKSILLLSLYCILNVAFAQPPNITTQPTNISACTDSAVCFSLIATGADLEYQWQENQGGGFVDLVNGGIYNDVDSAMFCISNLTSIMNGYQYRCIVTGSAAPPNDTTDTVTLFVLTPPQITTQPPSGIDICKDQDSSITLIATGSNLQYQWQLDDGNGFVDLINGGNYNDVDSATLQINSVASSMGGYVFRCIVSGACNPSDTSILTTINILEPPVITLQPVGDSICIGDNTSLTINATGTNISYQWQADLGGGFTDLINGAEYSGVASTTLSITAPTTGYNNYRYRCIVTGTCTPYDTSNIVSILVLETPVITPAGPFEIYAGEEIQISPTVSSATIYNWTPTTGIDNPETLSPTFSPLTTRTYTLEASNFGICDAEEMFTIIVLEIEIPTAFTPNGDGANDTWEIRGIDRYSGNRLEIYNNQGQLMYTTTDYNNSWAGTFNGARLPMDVYYYVLDLNVSNIEILEGTISLIK